MKREEVLSELEKVVASELFATGGRLAPFLRYVVENTLDGRSSELKETTIGSGVFGRAPDYDPRIDPVVRNEARRLRTRLADYYAGPGASDSIVIELPKGTYVPVFTSRECTPELRPQARRWPLVAGAAALFVALGLWWWWTSRAPAATSVAVLPFVNVSADPANEFFSDGLTDELIDSLSRVSGLRVVGRSLVFRQKGKPYDVQALGREWGVGAMVEGSVRKDGDRVRITAQLTDARDGYNVWSQTYDREWKDVFGVQREIAAAVARALRVKLAGSSRSEPNADAYRHLLEARYQFNRFNEDGFQHAVRNLQQAIAIDPSYAVAHAMLAKVYAMAGYYYIEQPPEAWAKAGAAAERAIELDPSSGEAYAARGFVLGLRDWKWTESEQAFRRALELEPGSADVHSGYATACLMPQGRLEEAVAEYRRSMEIDPLVMFANMGAAFAMLASGRYEEALRYYDRAIELNSSFSDLFWDRGMCLALMGRRDEALREFEKVRQMEGDSEIGPAPRALLGEPDAARRRMAQWLAGGGPDPDEYIDAARTYALLRDVAQTMAWLEKAWAVREPQMVWLKVDPRFALVRDTPEFRNMLRRLGL